MRGTSDVFDEPISDRLRAVVLAQKNGQRRPMVSQSSDESDWRQAQTEVMRLVESGSFPAAISYLETGKDVVTVSANYIRFAQWL